MRVRDLASGWKVLQDVHGLGEVMGLPDPAFTPTIGSGISPWRPIPRLAHLQVLLADQPHWGRALRSFNEQSWWYRLDFAAPAELGAALRLRFEGVDYFARCWLNGSELGTHEGYADAFEFAIDHVVDRVGTNTLVVQVGSPWDAVIAPTAGAGKPNRVGAIIRNLLKGTYEHADTFVQRDVNPIGIHAPVRLIGADAAFAHAPEIDVDPGEPGGDATLRARWPLTAVRALPGARLTLTIIDELTLRPVAEQESAIEVPTGESAPAITATLRAPRRWRPWDRGAPHRYRARLRLHHGGRVVAETERAFGVRRIALRRDAERTEAVLDGEAVYLRGTTYFPDVYVSRMDAARWRRDCAAMVAAGFNAVRVHVHQQPEGFYDECDRLGLMVVQDSDLNWRFPAADPAFCARAEAAFCRMLARLHHHPSIIAWVCVNEVHRDDDAGVALAKRLAAVAASADPRRSTIANAWIDDDPMSGDTHDYPGSLGGGSYRDAAGKRYKLLSEFGCDVPPGQQALLAEPELAATLAPLVPRLAELHDYQYHLLKFVIERQRLAKGDPSGGYFQFMWIDLCPQSFYGIMDYWGTPKVEGLGGGLRACREANQPVAVLLRHLEQAEAVWVVNDLPRAIPAARCEWTLLDADGAVIDRGERTIDVPRDGKVKVADLAVPTSGRRVHDVALVLRDAAGEVIASNRYPGAFALSPRPEGYPERMDHELGVRLWWA